MQRFFGVVLLLALFSAYGGAEAVAGQKVPMKISASLTICTAAECPAAVKLFGRGGPNRLFAVDVGNATHFGRFKTIYAADVGPDGSFVGQFLLTAADGSTFWGTNRGYLATPGNPPTPFEAKLIKGTKRFKFAKACVKGLITAGQGYQGIGQIILDTRR